MFLAGLAIIVPANSKYLVRKPCVTDDLGFVYTSTDKVSYYIILNIKLGAVVDQVKSESKI